MRKSVFLGLTVSFALFFSACNQNAEQSKNEGSVEIAEAQVTVAVDGMVCAMGCAGKIEETLNETPGVNSASVDFEAGTASIVYNSAEMSEEEVIAVIEGVNNGQYHATMLGEKSGSADGEAKNCTKPCDKPCTAEEKAACTSKGMKKQCASGANSEA
jgi:periplasmic mercuric ion binding protein